MLQRLATLTALLLLASSFAFAQAPPNLPGYQVQAFVGYMGIVGQNSGNGLFTSFAVPVKTLNQKWSMTLALRADNFAFTSPSENSLLGGVEQRFQTSSATFLDGMVIQPFVNEMFGETRATCVATSNCAAGVSTKSDFTSKIGGGIDIVTTQHTTWRILEFDHLWSRAFPGGGLTVSNANQLITAFGFHF